MGQECTWASVHSDFLMHEVRASALWFSVHAAAFLTLSKTRFRLSEVVNTAQGSRIHFPLLPPTPTQPRCIRKHAETNMGVTLFSKLQALFRTYWLSSRIPPFFTKTNPGVLHFIVTSPSPASVCDNFSDFVFRDITTSEEQ